MTGGGRGKRKRPSGNGARRGSSQQGAARCSTTAPAVGQHNKENRFPAERLTVVPHTGNNTREMQDVPEPRRSTRHVQATSHIDPEVALNLRPGNVTLRIPPLAATRASVSHRESNEDEYEEANIQDIRMEQGLGSDDEDYEELERPHHRRRHDADDEVHSSIVGSRNTATSAPASSTRQTQTFSATIHAAADPLVHPISQYSDRISALRRGQDHAILQAETPVQSLPIRSLVNSTVPLSSSSLVTAAARAEALRAASVLAETPPPSSISQPQHSPSPASSSAPTSHRGSLEFSGSHACSFEGGESNTDGAARQEARKAKKAMYNSRRKRYKHYHEDASLYKVIRKAGYLLQVLFSTSLPFPSDEARDDEIKLAFEKALDTFGFADDFYNLSIEDMKMLQQEDGSIRSRVQREVNARIATVYGLDPAPSPSQVLRNKERVSALLKDSAFHYESPETQEGRFQHPIIQQVIHAVWFSHRNALGCLYQDDFNPIPHATIALVLTSIRHTLSMYQTGKLVSGDFTHSYFTVYDQYVSSLAQMDEGDMRHFWRHHRRMMFKLGLDRAGVREDKEEELVIARAPQDVMAREIERMRLKMVSSDTSWDCNVSRNTSPVSNGSAAENQGRSSPSPCPPQYSIDLAPMMLGPCSSLPGPSTLTSPSSVVSAHSAITANMPSTGSCTQATSATPSETHLGPTNNDPPT